MAGKPLATFWTCQFLANVMVLQQVPVHIPGVQEYPGTNGTLSELPKQHSGGN